MLGEKGFQLGNPGRPGPGFRPGRPAMAADERELLFWRQVQLDDSDKCWNWIGTVGPAGYGTFRPDPHRTWRSQRAAFKYAIREPEPGMHIHHTCQNPGCCNPNHLEEISMGEHNQAHRRGLGTPKTRGGAA